VPGLREQLATATGAAFIAEAIRLTESRNIAAAEVFDILSRVRATLPPRSAAAQKLAQVLEDNPGLFEFRARMLRHHCYAFPPLSTAEVERSFSALRAVHTDRRRRLTEKNLAQLTAIKFNRK